MYACTVTPSLFSLDSPEVFQTPNAISLMKVNSTAEIQCRTTLENPTGLYLKRRFSMEMEVLYISEPARKLTIHPDYTRRWMLSLRTTAVPAGSERYRWVLLHMDQAKRDIWDREEIQQHGHNHHRPRYTKTHFDGCRELARVEYGSLKLLGTPQNHFSIRSAAL